MYKNLLLIVKLWDMKNAFLEWCKLKTHLFVLIGLFLTIGLHAQQKVITGKVLDEIGEPIVGANVVEKGTTNGTISDVEGDFSLKIDSDASITISFLGYVQQEISVRNKTNITVKLIEDSKSLDEVVVIGYGSARKRDLTGAVAQVKSSDLQNESPSSMQDLLRANIPGLNVGFSAGPKPGGSLQIRGRNSINAGTDPLIVLDGVIYPGDLSDINANDIEQIDVLKDASSAAIYGARSASGVIIITTKMGKSVKPTVKFDVTLGIASMQKRQRVYGPEEFLAWRGDVLESINVNHKPYEYDDPRTLPSDISVEDWLAYDNSKGDPVEVWLGRLSLKPIEIQNYLAGKTVDWEDMVFQNGFRQDYNASISGKSNGLNYFWSMGYTNNEGLSVGNGYKSFRTRLNLDTKITDFLTIGLNSQFVSRDGSAIGADWAQYQKLTPYGSPTNEDGSLKLNPTDDRESKHPLIDAYYTDKKMMTNNLNANIYAKVTLPYNISYQMNFSPRYEWVDDYEHKSSNHPGWADLGGTAYRNTRKDFLWQLDNIVKWQQCFNNAHDIDFTFLFNAEKFQRWTGKMSNEQFSPTDILGFHNIGAGSNPIISSNDEYRTGDALMARIFYSYKQRYMTTVTVRRDGYSAFGQENPRAVFPSAALGWVFSDESFLKHAKWLDYGKLRVSWGVNGNRDIGVYRALAQLTDNKYLYVKPDGTV
ncbi:SusC/RagA family TonB-linked outer membrane protein [Bacteroides salyersiae]|uniref:SusC/RagA family TonB-linked outer membrane protein n=1 Tax=Bacteroides salyersiae TaxID=291644 RepID=UPI001F026BBF|nr:SusC/RagA family TonB-linked outer membrane protein [Bacteroides salyersiae]